MQDELEACIFIRLFRIPRHRHGLCTLSCGPRAFLSNCVSCLRSADERCPNCLRWHSASGLAICLTSATPSGAITANTVRRSASPRRRSIRRCDSSLSSIRVMSGARDTSRSASRSVGNPRGRSARNRRRMLYCWAVRSNWANRASSSARSRSYVRQRFR